MPGDDYGMMREMLQRRFKPLGGRGATPGGCSTVGSRAKGIVAAAPAHDGAPIDDAGSGHGEGEPPWPGLVLIDGGRGQLAVAHDTLAALGLSDIPLVAVAKGRIAMQAGDLFLPGREPLKLNPRDPVLYFVQRLRDEAHRFAVGSHRVRRRRDIREAGLQEIPGIGPTRKRALLRHFGTLKAIERAAFADLAKVPGINAETARKIYDFFQSLRVDEETREWRDPRIPSSGT